MEPGGLTARALPVAWCFPSTTAEQRAAEARAQLPTVTQQTCAHPFL